MSWAARSKRSKPARRSVPDAVAPRFHIGDRVKVRNAYPIGHVRTPYYVRGKRGVIERICGAFPNPEELAYGFSGEPKRVLYRVRFSMRDVWSDYRGARGDLIEVEIYEHWLDPA